MKPAEAGRGVWVVIPTYNERATIGPLLSAVRKVLPEAVLLVVDDGSPDGTADVVRAAAREDAGIRLLERNGPRGYGAAVRAGLEEAFRQGAEVAATIDADLSHDPKLLPRLVAAVREGADLAIGSRYIPGGGIDADWAIHRRLLSRAGNRIYRMLLGPVAHDLTSGLRAYGRSALAKVPPASVRSESYSFLAEYAVRLSRAGGRIVEVPLRFVDRAAGASKMPRREILRALATAVRLAREGGAERGGHRGDSREA